VNEWILSISFPDKIICYLTTKCAEKQIFASQHQGHCSLRPFDVFFSTCIALPLFDLGVNPEDLGIVIDKKLLNNSYEVYYIVQIPIKSDQISSCISKYEIK